MQSVEKICLSTVSENDIDDSESIQGVAALPYVISHFVFVYVCVCLCVYYSSFLYFECGAFLSPFLFSQAHLTEECASTCDLFVTQRTDVEVEALAFLTVDIIGYEIREDFRQKSYVIFFFLHLLMH